jgi:trimeric autotransporter adhesin
MAQNISYNGNTVPINGVFNTAFGIQALFSNTTGRHNFATGYNALFANTIGDNNTAIGSWTLDHNTTGIVNVGIGPGALSGNTTGSFNIGIGTSTVAFNVNGDANTGVGSGALLYTTGSYNSGFGENTLTNNISGSYNTAIGSKANVINGTVLTNATAIGYNAIVNASNTIQLGNRNVTKVYAGTGVNATVIAGGLQITGGTLAFGNVLTSDINGVATWQPPTGGGTVGWGLTGNAGTVDGTNFIGTTDNVPFNIRVNNRQAGKIDAFSYGSTFYGYGAGINNLNSSLGNGGEYNTGIGAESLLSNTTGTYNTAIGALSLKNNLDGAFNTAIGTASLFSNINGNGNIGLGHASLNSNKSGIENIGIGFTALALNINGNRNIAIGTDALINTLTDGNIGIGFEALDLNSLGRLNTSLGFRSNVSNQSFVDATAIGAYAIVNASNKIRLGDVNVSVVETQTAYSPSDGRFKNNINDKEVKGLEFINLLRPVVYNFDTRKFEEFLTQNMPDSTRHKYLDRNFEQSTAIRQSGFIAQEVEAAAKQTGYNFNGVHVPETKDDNYSLAYAQFTVPLVKAVQELSKQNDDLKKEMAELRSMLTALKSNTIEGSIKITEATTEAKLYQNAPNPFSKTTTIRYSLPSTAKRAAISITTIAGIKVKTFELNSKNGEALNINGGELSAGTYIYTLVVDDVLVDSKKMVLTK